MLVLITSESTAQVPELEHQTDATASQHLRPPEIERAIATSRIDASQLGWIISPGELAALKQLRALQEILKQSGVLFGRSLWETFQDVPGLSGIDPRAKESESIDPSRSGLLGSDRARGTRNPWDVDGLPAFFHVPALGLGGIAGKDSKDGGSVEKKGAADGKKQATDGSTGSPEGGGGSGEAREVVEEDGIVWTEATLPNGGTKRSGSLHFLPGGHVISIIQVTNPDGSGSTTWESQNGDISDRWVYKTDSSGQSTESHEWKRGESSGAWRSGDLVKSLSALPNEEGGAYADYAIMFARNLRFSCFWIDPKTGVAACATDSALGSVDQVQLDPDYAPVLDGSRLGLSRHTLVVNPSPDGTPSGGGSGVKTTPDPGARPPSEP